MNQLFTCPGCGYKTRSEEDFGSYDICEICGWEDDCVQLSNPLSGGGANKESLYETQITFFEKSLGIKTSFEKDSSWRRLNDNEIESYLDQKTRNYWNNYAITDFDYAYWNIARMRDEIELRIESMVSCARPFKNHHGISLSNIKSHRIRPEFVSVDLDDARGGKDWFWVFLVEAKNLEDGFSVGCTIDMGTFSVIEFDKTKNKFTQLIVGSSFEEALEGM